MLPITFEYSTPSKPHVSCHNSALNWVECGIRITCNSIFRTRLVFQNCQVGFGLLCHLENRIQSFIFCGLHHITQAKAMSTAFFLCLFLSVSNFTFFILTRNFISNYKTISRDLYPEDGLSCVSGNPVSILVNKLRSFFSNHNVCDTNVGPFGNYSDSEDQTVSGMNLQAEHLNIDGDKFVKSQKSLAGFFRNFKQIVIPFSLVVLNTTSSFLHPPILIPLDIKLWHIGLSQNQQQQL